MLDSRIAIATFERVAAEIKTSPETAKVELEPIPIDGSEFLASNTHANRGGAFVAEGTFNGRDAHLMGVFKDSGETITSMQFIIDSSSVASVRSFDGDGNFAPIQDSITQPK